MFCQANCSQQMNFSCPQLIDYCIKYQNWIKIESSINNVINFLLLVFGLGGLISYILMLIVFRSIDFNGPSYVYHKSIAWMEILHMFVMAQAGLERFLSLDKTTYSYIFYIKILRELWLFGDAMKLSTSIITMFLSMERFIAICSHKNFNRFNRSKIAWSLVICSFLFSLLSFSPALTEKIERQLIDNVSIWVAVPKNYHLDSNVGGDIIITNLIYGAKCVTSLAMIIFCIGIIIGLILRSKKVASMTSTASLRWKENRRLSILQLVIALLQIIDHVMWVINNIIYDQKPSAELEAVMKLNYDQAIDVLNYKALWRWTMAGQEITGILDHAIRLPLYLMGMKKFREQFLNLFKRNELYAIKVFLKPNVVAPIL